MSLSDRRRADAPAATLADAAYRALDRAGIAWALLREPDPGEAAPDVDLLVAGGRAHLVRPAPTRRAGSARRLLSPTGS